MIYTFRTLNGLIQHLRALCELSGSIYHSPLPLKDFETDLPYLLDDCRLIRKLAKKFRNPGSIYIAFRTHGFESSVLLHHFKSRVTAFQNSLIACYTIQFADGFYIVKKYNL